MEVKSTDSEQFNFVFIISSAIYIPYIIKQYCNLMGPGKGRSDIYYTDGSMREAGNRLSPFLILNGKERKNIAK